MDNQILQQILDELKIIKTDVSDLKTDVSGLKTDVSSLKAGQERIEKKLDSVYEQTADLTEFSADANTKLDNIHNRIHKLSSDFITVEAITGKNMQDIAHLKSIK